MMEEYLEIEAAHMISEQYEHEEKLLPNETAANMMPQLEQPSFAPMEMNKTSCQSTPMASEVDAHDGDFMLKKLLRKFQMDFLYSVLKAADVTYRSLRYLSVDDINTVIRSVGHRAEFREKLFTWRRKRYRTNDAIIEINKLINPSTNRGTLDITQSQASQTKDNIRETFIPSNTFTSATELNNNTTVIAVTENTLPNDIKENSIRGSRKHTAKRRKLDENNFEATDTSQLAGVINLENILDESLFGTAMRQFYKLNGYLERRHRDEIIQLIVDYVTTNDIKLHYSDFIKITEMIANIFPSEEYSKEYYFINRKGKRNPMGRLYTKYYNTLKRLKVRDMQRQQQHLQCHQEQQCQYDDISRESDAAARNLIILERDNDNNTWDNEDVNSQIEFVEEELVEEVLNLDDTTLSSISSIKQYLRNSDLFWNDVKALWAKTYIDRQKDIQLKSATDVMEEWPKYLTERGIELYDIDFNMKFGCKNNILQQKWANFQQKIYQYYHTNVKDEICRNLFTLYKTKPGKDSEDFILTVLLNAIIIPTARYRDSNGNRRKISIVDAVEMFAFRLTHLNELETKRQDILMRYGDLRQSKLGPYIIIVGDGNITIHEIYVQFHVALYEMPDFLSALDCCIKIYRVLNIPYPPANEYIWTFLQRYFYELTFDEDVKSPLLASILAFLKF